MNMIFRILDVGWGILRAYGWWILSFLMRARNVLRSSPRISEAPFLPLTFQLVCSDISALCVELAAGCKAPGLSVQIQRLISMLFAQGHL